MLACSSAFLDRLEISRPDWIGTSMGGLIAMAIAGIREAPFRSLVLNDIGPLVPKSALGMIRDYLGLDLAFPSINALEEHLRLIHAPLRPRSPTSSGAISLSTAPEKTVSSGDCITTRPSASAVRQGRRERVSTFGLSSDEDAGDCPTRAKVDGGSAGDPDVDAN